jgi:hypothetical protein
MRLNVVPLDRQAMDVREVSQLVDAELSRGDAFENLHGITVKNVRQFLVPPYEATVDPDDGESAPRAMWVVLHERSTVGEGYVVVLDPLDGSWGVAEATAVRGGFIMVITADTMFGALDGM